LTKGTNIFWIWRNRGVLRPAGQGKKRESEKGISVLMQEKWFVAAPPTKGFKPKVNIGGRKKRNVKLTVTIENGGSSGDNNLREGDPRSCKLEDDAEGAGVPVDG